MSVRVRAFFMFVRLCARGVGWKISIMVVGVDRCSNLIKLLHWSKRGHGVGDVRNGGEM